MNIATIKLCLAMMGQEKELSGSIGVTKINAKRGEHQEQFRS